MMQTMQLMTGYLNDELKNEMKQDERVLGELISARQAEAEHDEWVEVCLTLKLTGELWKCGDGNVSKTVAEI